MEVLKADVASGTPITREHISQLRKHPQIENIITVPCETVDEDGEDTSAENTSVKNDVNESIDSHDTETDDKVMTEKHVGNKEDTSVSPNTDETSLDNGLPADDLEDDETEEEDDNEMGRRKYDTLRELMCDSELRYYIANSDLVYEEFCSLCRDISDAINDIAAERESLNE